MRKFINSFFIFLFLMLILAGCGANKASKSGISSAPDVSGTSSTVETNESSAEISSSSSEDVSSAPVSSDAPPPQLPGSAALKKGMTEAEYAIAYSIALEIVNRHRDKEEIDMLCRISEDIYNIYKSGVHSESDPHYSDVYGVFMLKRASCAGVTRAVCLCMEILGKPYEHINENKWEHQWCRVFSETENAYLVLDAQGGFVGPENAPYKHPLM